MSRYEYKTATTTKTGRCACVYVLREASLSGLSEGLEREEAVREFVREHRAEVCARPE